MEAIRKAIGVAISLGAIASVPSAYIFGLSVLFPVSIRTLLDYQFYGNELVLMVVFLAGFGAVIRMQFVLMKAIHQRFISQTMAFTEGMPPSRITRRRRVGWFLLACTAVGLVLLTVLVTSILFVPRLFFEWLAWSSTILMIGGFMVVSMETDTEFSLSSCIANLKKIFGSDLASLVGKPLTVSFLVGLCVFSSFSLGAARIKSLASARDVCVYLEQGKTRGKLLGEASSGIFLKTGELELRPYFDFSGRLNRFSDPQHQVIFINRNHVRSVDPFC